jgi:alanine or glycine:cation symporter, AGCS family
MGGIYVLGAITVLIIHVEAIPGMLVRIVTEAFTGTAAGGGLAGIAVSQVLITGVRRAAFSNEAGLGSAPIAHSAATTNEPVREGVVALLEPFIDTVVICTMTALVILASGVWTHEATGVQLTADAFDTVLPGFGRLFVPIAVTMFAYSTLISWSYYGEQAVTYITKGRSEVAILLYKLAFCILAVVGAVWAIIPVLNFADIMLGLMVVPNLIAVWMLLPVLRKDTREYFDKLDSGAFEADALEAARHRHERGMK